MKIRELDPKLLGRVAATVLLVALVAALALSGRAGSSRADSASPPSDEALAVAEERVVQLTTLDHRRIDQQLADLREGLSGDFRQQFEATLATLRSTVTDNRILSTGSVAASGVVAADDGSAEILVAANAEVRSAGSAPPEQRSYRIDVSLVREDGRWLVSGMEFVS